MIWKNVKEIHREGLEYIEKCKNGTVLSLKTGWDQFNNIGINRLEFNSLYIISSRPGVGKTLIINNIARDLFTYNPTEQFAVLHFQFEMNSISLALRYFSSSKGINIRDLQSDGKPLNETLYNSLKSDVDFGPVRQEFVVENSCTVLEMRNIVESFYKTYKIPFIVTLDHTLLIKRSPIEPNRQATLENLATMLTEVKKKLPVCFLILSQLNREIESFERTEPCKSGNYPTEADVYGSKMIGSYVVFYQIQTTYKKLR